jgi:uncharacterized protein YndB with AHSA1/START domain
VKSAGPLLAILAVPLIVIGGTIAISGAEPHRIFTYGFLAFAIGTTATTTTAASRKPDLSKGIDERAITAYGLLVGASAAFGLGTLTFALASGWPIVGLAVAGVGTAWFAAWLPARFRTMTAECSIVINRDVSVVFALLSDPRKLVEWDPRYESIELLTPEPVGPGTLFRGRVRLANGNPFTGVEQIIDFVPNRRLSSSAVSPVRNLDVVTFEAEGGGTRVTRRFRIEFQLWMALLGVAFFKASVARDSVTNQEAAWARAKQLLEDQVRA